MAGIWAPMAERRSLGRALSKVPLQHDIICLHTMVGTLEGSYSWSKRPGGTYWHFGISGNGKTIQCQDLRYRSAANLNGNWRVIPIETADTYEGIWGPPPSCGRVPAWTAKQIDAIVDLVAWLCARFNIPPVLIPDTKPGRRGIAYHRQGIPPHLVPGGEKWSNAAGKCCPDSARIHQLVTIVIPRVQARLKAAPSPTAPKSKDWFSMATEAQLRKVVREEVDAKPAAVRVVRNGWKKGDPVYISDLASYKMPVRHNGPLDKLRQFFDAIAGHKQAVRVDQAVLDELPTIGEARERELAQEAVHNVITWYGAVGDSPLHDIVRQVIEQEKQTQ